MQTHQEAVTPARQSSRCLRFQHLCQPHRCLTAGCRCRLRRGQLIGGGQHRVQPGETKLSPDGCYRGCRCGSVRIVGFFWSDFAGRLRPLFYNYCGAIVPLAGRLWFQIPFVSGEVVREGNDKGECGEEQCGVLCQTACPREIHTGALSRV